MLHLFISGSMPSWMGNQWLDIMHYMLLLYYITFGTHGLQFVDDWRLSNI